MLKTVTKWCRMQNTNRSHYLGCKGVNTYNTVRSWVCGFETAAYIQTSKALWVCSANLNQSINQPIACIHTTPKNQMRQALTCGSLTIPTQTCPTIIYRPRYDSNFRSSIDARQEMIEEHSCKSACSKLPCQNKRCQKKQSSKDVYW